MSLMGQQRPIERATATSAVALEADIRLRRRKSRFRRSGDPYEAGHAAFVGAIGPPIGIRCREKRNKARSR